MFKKDKVEAFFFPNSCLLVPSRAYWRKHCRKMAISKMATVFYEAFALFCW